MKKLYQRPTMRVVELQHRTLLLTQSSDQWLNYAPGLTPADTNLMA